MYIFWKRRNSKGAGGNFGKVWYFSGFDDSNGFIGVHLSSKFISLCVEREKDKQEEKQREKKKLLMKLKNMSLVGYPINN